MEIKLMKITLNNFKGIEHLEVAANGDDVNIYGANESGKTTVSDAYNWLLFNKDSQNNAEFGIKTLKDGKEINGLNHIVEAEMIIDDKPVTLKKTYREVWTKKRGQTSKSFTGHETDYEINTVPKKKKEFDAYIKSFIDDIEIFRLVNDPLYFNTLKTDVKRGILLDIAGDITDAEVIEGNKQLHPLKAHMEQFNIEELRAKNKRDKSAINDKLEENPVRIDELKKSMADSKTDVNEKELSEQMEQHHKVIEVTSKKIDDVITGKERQELKRKLYNIQEEQETKISNELKETEKALSEYLAGFDDDVSHTVRKLKLEAEFEQDNLQVFESRKKNKLEQIEIQKRYVNDLRADHKGITIKLKEIQEERKEFDIETICSCCGQELPADKVEEHREQQQTKYNEERAKQIEVYQADLTSLVKKGKEAAASVEAMQKELETIESGIERIANIVKTNNERIAELSGKVVDPKETAEYKRYKDMEKMLIDANANLEKDLPVHNKEFKQLQAELTALESNNDEKVREYQKEIEQRRMAMNELYSMQSKLDVVKESEARIAMLLEEQEKLAAEYENLEHIENMLNEFTTTKVKMLENNISSKFKYARFNLFENQINGGLKEICETTYKGVPYSKGLNTAGRIQVGVDILNTLAAHYEFYVPIIVDNAESITDIPETKSQQVRLIVDANNEKLKVESVK